jgi:cytochrome c biogenesis protein CcmG, thiol:disulfide interchange protein DsbE
VRRALTLALVALLLTGCSSDPSKAQSDRLPDVTLDSLTGGQPVDLGDLRGPVVVNLWAQWCKPCKRELPIYQTFYQQHHDRVSVLGVDWQDVQTDRARKLASKSGVTYPLVVDGEPEIRNKLLPTLILVDKQGKVAYRESVEITSLAQLERLVEKHLGVTL